METQDTQTVSEEFSDDDEAISPDLPARIIEVAQGKFFALGYARVSMNEIAQELHISKKTLYREFRTKEDLLRAIVLPMIHIGAAKNDAVLQDQSLPYHERLSFLMESMGKVGSKFSGVLMEDVYTQAPEVWQDIERFRKKRALKLQGLIQEGIDKKYLRADIPAELAARFYGSAVEALITPAVLAEMPFTTKEAYVGLISILFEGLANEETRKELQADRAAIRAAKGTK
ncbi:MAG: TetR/AcrR family transcriptional regulator [Candidatus Kapaibacterium sp.]|jgi:AcrR family transcriptional regulator